MNIHMPLQSTFGLGIRLVADGTFCKAWVAHILRVSEY